MQTIVTEKPGAWVAKLDLWCNITLAEAKVMLDRMADRLPIDQCPPRRHIYSLYDGTLLLSKKPMPPNFRKMLGGEIVHEEEYEAVRSTGVWRRLPVDTAPVKSDDSGIHHALELGDVMTHHIIKAVEESRNG